MGKPASLLGNAQLFFFGCALAFLGGIIAWHHPILGWQAVLVFAALVCLTAYAFVLWPTGLLALMPVIAFAPWTGWITFEEFDLLILAIAAGGYLRVSISGNSDTKSCSRTSFGQIIRVCLLGIYGFGIFISMFRGFQDAGGFNFGWYQGYFGPMNSVRLAKSFFLSALLLPLWLWHERMYPERSVTLLGWGGASGLGLASLAAMWERVAFVGLLNFSSDYRTTALFWETHVGGAAFDAFLAISFPFALFCYLRSIDLPKRIISAVILVLAGYASLTTFSRGVYLAVPVGLAIFVILNHWRGQFGKQVGSNMPQSRYWMLGGILVFGGMAYWVFPTSGYRGMLAVLLTFYLMVTWLPIVANGRPARWHSIVTWMLGASMIAFLGTLFPKGGYGIFGIGMAMVAIGSGVAVTLRRSLPVCVAGYWLSVLGCGLIAQQWGGESALRAMLPVCLLLVLGGGAVFFVQIPVREGGRHLGLLSGMVVTGLLVTTFFGGQYMADRFSTTERDFEYRLTHWKGALGLMDGYDFLFGKGLGRFPASYFFAAPPSEHPGGFGLVEKGGESYLLIAGGRHVLGWGELFRVSQRVSPGTFPYLVEWDVKAESDVRVHFEICEKHLLYNAVCVVNSAAVKGNKSGWQHAQLVLTGDPPSRGDWYAPKIITFSVAIEDRGGRAYLDNISLRDGHGVSLLSNGDFSQGLARWFSSSDRHHMPWHMKNIFMHVLFEQGVFGLIMLSILLFMAFFRLTVGDARHYPLAPALVGGLAGFVLVGMFDSLLDVPRLSLLFYFLLMISLIIQTSSNDGRDDRKPRVQRY